MSGSRLSCPVRPTPAALPDTDEGPRTPTPTGARPLFGAPEDDSLGESAGRPTGRPTVGMESWAFGVPTDREMELGWGERRKKGEKKVKALEQRSSRESPCSKLYSIYSDSRILC